MPLREELVLGVAAPEPLWLCVRLPDREGVRQDEGVLVPEEVADAAGKEMRRIRWSLLSAWPQRGAWGRHRRRRRKEGAG